MRQSKLLEMIISFLALRHDMLGIFPMIGARPTADTLQNRHYGPALFSQRILYPRWYFIVTTPNPDNKKEL